ncbi:hypothetical protein FB446DRAFT_710107 [Lentinula raphanica]|nr:hypothetical protein FB446DRAFT_710107 [Lentinula raphanica]
MDSPSLVPDSNSELHNPVAPPEYDEVVERSIRTEREMSLERHVANLISEVSDERETAVLQSQRAKFYMDQRDVALRRHRRAEKAALQRLIALRTAQAKVGFHISRSVRLAEYSHRLSQADASPLYSNLIHNNLRFLIAEIQRIHHVGVHTNNHNMISASLRIEEIVYAMELQRFRLDSARLSVIGVGETTRDDKELVEGLISQRFPSVTDLLDQSSFQVVPSTRVIPIPTTGISPDPATQYQVPGMVPVTPFPIHEPASPALSSSASSTSSSSSAIAGPIAPRRRQFGYRGRGRTLNRRRIPTPDSSSSAWSNSTDDLVYPQEDLRSPSPMELEGNSRNSTPGGYSEQGSAGIRSP